GDCGLAHTPVRCPVALAVQPQSPPLNLAKFSPRAANEALAQSADVQAEQAAQVVEAILAKGKKKWSASLRKWAETFDLLDEDGKLKKDYLPKEEPPAAEEPSAAVEEPPAAAEEPLVAAEEPPAPAPEPEPLAPAPEPEPTPPAEAAIDKVAQHTEKLKAATYNNDVFDQAVKELRLDKDVTKEQLAQISKAFSGVGK